MEPSRAEVMDALHASSDRFIRLVESLEPADGSKAVPGLEWNVAETVAHVLTVVRRAFADRRRSESAGATAALNQTVLDEMPERDLDDLARLLRQDVATALHVVFPKIPDDREFPFHGGVTTTMTPALRIVLGEYVIHGYDVARAVGRPWIITEPEARMLVAHDLLGAWVRPDAAEQVFELRLGDLAPLRFELGPSRLRVSEGTGGTVITMDLLTFVLAFYNREPVGDDALLRLLVNFVPS